MLLLQFSTSHYCRKARLALGYKGIAYRTRNLTPGLHALQLKPLTGLTAVPVLLPELEGHPRAIADSSRILRFLDTLQPDPPLLPSAPNAALTARTLEDWLDESIGTAVRFVYYDYRAGEGRHLDPSPASLAAIQAIRWQYGIDRAAVDLAKERIDLAIAYLQQAWEANPYLVGDRLSVADIAAAALLSPLARVPPYPERFPWLWQRLVEIHDLCREPLPPGL